MNVSIYVAKTHFSELIGKVEQGQELIVHRRNRPVARIVPIQTAPDRRIGILAGRKLRIGSGFDKSMSESLGDLFGIPPRSKL